MLKDVPGNTKETSENSRCQEMTGCGIQNMPIQNKVRLNPLPHILVKTEGQEIEAV